MPFYEYLCDVCDEITTQFRSVEDRDLVDDCSSCGDQREVKRVVAAPRIWAPTRNGQ